MGTEPYTYRLGIALLGKGSTNHLHRKEVVSACQGQGIQVIFLVRKDYYEIIEKIPHCQYRAVTFEPIQGWRTHLYSLFEHIRNLYPINDPGRAAYFKLYNRYKRSTRFRFFTVLYNFIGRFQWMMKLFVFCGGFLSQSENINGLSPREIDQLLLLGIGTASSELEGHFTWWAQQYNLSVVHIVGNYDNLSSKGFRGVDVNRLLVWGPNMINDAVGIHGISKDKITAIGPLRYNINLNLLNTEKDEFFRSIGFDPNKKTILFAGFLFEFHYFEMLEIFREINSNKSKYQMIFRLYPNKHFMNSPYVKTLIDYASQVSGVYVSLADPHYAKGVRNQSVLQIEEYELWNSLKSCDVVVNIYSTISLEACIFDTPAINMWYFGEPSPAFARTPLNFDYAALFHNRRITSYGAIRTALNRKELLVYLKDALKNPERLSSQRKHTVEVECGALDGKACERLVVACRKEYEAHLL